MWSSVSKHLPTKGWPRMDVKPEWSKTDATYDDPWPQTVPEYERLVDTYLNRLVQFALRRVGKVQDAEDIVQNVLISAFHDRAKRQEVTAVGAYLYRSVANACVDLLRKKDLSSVYREEVAVETLLIDTDDPSELAALSDEWRRAKRLLARLPEDQAEVVRLRVFDGLRLSQIAKVVGCSVNTVCSRLRYGFRKLRNLIDDKQE